MAQSDLELRAMEPADWPAVAALIYESTNAWYVGHGKPAIFSGPTSHSERFCQVYEDLDPGCCLVAADRARGTIAGSCFYHPRSTHVSLGIMNAHPAYFGQGVARRLLQWIADFADQRQQELRLVSSAMNLDSYSLYSRAGFVPRVVFQDMIMTVPAGGLSSSPPAGIQVRAATAEDVRAIRALERELVGIDRDNDYQYFVENRRGIWRLLVAENERGELVGFLNSVSHPASQMLGPGVCRDEQAAAALIYGQLDQQRGLTKVWLVPAAYPQLVQTMYAWGAKNCELHFAQTRGGNWQEPRGVILPTFMPETG